MKEDQRPIAHVMLDIETLGTTKESIIISCALKSFTLPGQLNAVDAEVEYQRSISVASSILYHRYVDYDTAEWWRSPKRKTAFDKMLADQKEAITIDQFGQELYPLLTELNKKYNLQIWGRGVGSFDMPILSSTLEAVIGDTYREPWGYWAANDVRTLYRFAGWAGMEQPEQETPHDAMADCLKEINEVLRVWYFIHSGIQHVSE